MDDAKHTLANDSTATVDPFGNFETSSLGWSESEFAVDSGSGKIRNFPRRPWSLIARVLGSFVVVSSALAIYTFVSAAERRDVVESALRDSLAAIRETVEFEMRRRLENAEPQDESSDGLVIDVERQSDQSIEIGSSQMGGSPLNFNDDFWKALTGHRQTCLVGPAFPWSSTQDSTGESSSLPMLHVAKLLDSRRGSSFARVKSIPSTTLNRIVAMTPTSGLTIIDINSNKIDFGQAKRGSILPIIASELLRGGSGQSIHLGWFRDATSRRWVWNRQWQIGYVISRSEGPIISWPAWFAALLPAIVLAGFWPRLNRWSQFAINIASPFWVSATNKVDSADHSVVGPGSTLGNYQLNEIIGRGSMGMVYRGVHKFLKREAAIKVLNGRNLPKTAIKRFEREVRLTSRLKHPNTISIFDYGRFNSNFYYVMEYIDGVTLQQLITIDGPQPASRVIHLLLQVCGSMAEAHSLGLIHRDIKPANVLLSGGLETSDLVKIVDFGLIKDISNYDPLITRNDSITGTPMYMSPEAVRDAASANTQSDLYSIGAVGYTLLTGLPMFEPGSSVEICVKQIHELPLPPSQRCDRDIPSDLESVLMVAIAKDPADRWNSVADFATALRRCQDAFEWTPTDIESWWSDWRIRQDGRAISPPLEQAERTVKTSQSSSS